MQPDLRKANKRTQVEPLTIMKQEQKPSLILIQSTDSPIELHLEKGIWDRQRFSLEQYAKEFKVYYYTSDLRSYQDLMPSGVTHKKAMMIIRPFGFRHILYYLYLVLSSFQWRAWSVPV